MKLEPIVTPRLVVVPVAADTAAAILAGDLSQIAAGSRWPHADTLDGLRMGGCWLVTLDGVVIGDCGTHGEPGANGEVEIGYGLAEPSRGLGYGTELVAALSAWLLARSDVKRVVAGSVEVGNAPSRRALVRAGFRLERVDERHGWYARHEKDAEGAA
jgi:RimJ/RimL family protein N-acetyltransferase